MDEGSFIDVIEGELDNFLPRALRLHFLDGVFCKLFGVFGVFVFGTCNERCLEGVTG